MTSAEPNLEIQFSLGLDTVIAHESVQDSDGDLIGHGPVTLADRIAEIIASKLVERAGREWLPNVRVSAETVANQLVEAKMRDVLEREVVPTDSWGQAKGEPTTLGELIAKRAEAWLTTDHKKDGGYGRGSGKTNLVAMIDDAVGRQFQTVLTKAVAEAQAAATQAVSVKAAEVFAEIIRRAAS